MNTRITPRRRALTLAAAAVVVLVGCTAESVRVALETQRRADEVQQGIFDAQHAGLRVLLYSDLVTRLAAGAEGGLSDQQRALVNAAWNERDLVEFWAVQYERSKALRLIGVDAKLYADQSIVDLLIKALEAKAGRVQQRFADAAAERAAGGIVPVAPAIVPAAPAIVPPAPATSPVIAPEGEVQP
jgi:hypothetical protein